MLSCISAWRVPQYLQRRTPDPLFSHLTVQMLSPAGALLRGRKRLLFWAETGSDKGENERKRNHGFSIFVCLSAYWSKVAKGRHWYFSSLEAPKAPACPTMWRSRETERNRESARPWPNLQPHCIHPAPNSWQIKAPLLCSALPLSQAVLNQCVHPAAVEQNASDVLPYFSSGTAPVHQSISLSLLLSPHFQRILIWWDNFTSVRRQL